jgi:hypothetical protein
MHLLMLLCDSLVVLDDPVHLSVCLDQRTHLVAEFGAYPSRRWIDARLQRCREFVDVLSEFIVVIVAFQDVFRITGSRSGTDDTDEKRWFVLLLLETSKHSPLHGHRFATGSDRFCVLESWDCDCTLIHCDTGFVMIYISVLRHRSSPSQGIAPDRPFMLQELALGLRGLTNSKWCTESQPFHESRLPSHMILALR